MLEVVPADANCWQIPGALFLDRPVDKMLADLARVHCANPTGYLDWNKGAVPAGKPLQKISPAMCDSLLCRIIVPEYNVNIDKDGKVTIKSSVAKFIHERIHDLWKDATGIEIPHKDVQLKGIHELGKPLACFKGERERLATHELSEQDVSVGLREDRARVQAERVLLGRIRRKEPEIEIPARTVKLESKETRYFEQCFKIQLPNMPLQHVLDMVGRGALAKVGIYHKEIDITVDCLGSVRKHDVINALINKDGSGFRMQGESDGGAFCDKTILDNDKEVGRNCLTYMFKTHTPQSTIDLASSDAAPRLKVDPTFATRSKAPYLKMVCNLEKRALTKSVGTAAGYWGTLQFDMLSRSRDHTTNGGYSRIETTIYGNRPNIPIEMAHNWIPRRVADAEKVVDDVIACIPTEQVLVSPHALLWENYTSILRHSLVVVDSRYDRALVVFSTNEVTNCVAAIDVGNWADVYKFVLQRLAIGNTHTDVITIHRGRDYKKPNRELTKQEATAKKRQADAVREEAQKRQRIAAEAYAKRNPVTVPPPVPSDSESDSDSEEEEEQVEATSVDQEDDASEARTAFTATVEPACAYTPGWVAPEDGLGCLLTSERVLRVPVKLSDVEPDGSYKPTTRLVADHAGHHFRAADPPRGWNADGTHHDDAGEKPLTIGLNWEKIGKKPGKHTRQLTTSTLVKALEKRLTLSPSELQDVCREVGGQLHAHDAVKVGSAFFMPTFARELAKDQLERAGMQPNEHVTVETYPYIRPANAQHYAKIVGCVSKLPIDARPVLKKRVLDTVPKETTEERMERLIASTTTGMDERDGLVEKQLVEIRLADYCEKLLSSKHGSQGAALESVVVDEPYTITAVQILGSPSTDAHIVPRMVLFLQANDTDKIESFACSMPLAAAIFKKGDELKSLFFSNPTKKERFLFDPTGTGTAIGSLKRLEKAPVNKKTKKKGILLEVQIGDSFEFSGDALAQPTPIANDALSDSMEVDPEKPPSITIQPGDRKNIDLMSKGAITAGELVKVLRVGEPISYSNRMLLPLEIQADGGATRIIFGAANVIEIKDQLVRDSSIYIEKVFAKDIKPLVVRAGEWWVVAQAKYKSLPSISRKTKLPNPTITGARQVENERRTPVWVVQTADESIYKFEHPNHAHSLELSTNVGKKLDAANWSMCSA